MNILKNDTNRSQIAALVKGREHLWWWVENPNMISVESLVEGILSYGDMEDIRVLFQTLGKNRVKSIFMNQIKRKRCNYRAQTINFFSKVFSINV